MSDDGVKPPLTEPPPLGEPPESSQRGVVVTSRGEVTRLRTWKRSITRFQSFHAAGAPLTWTLVVVCVFLHLVTGVVDFAAGQADAWGIVFGARSGETLTLLGGRNHDRVAAGEVWRLVSAGFLHGDASHLFFNGLALVGLGRMSEASFGGLRTLWIFLLSVVGGNILSQMGDAPLSIGASGGVFGLMGALVAFGWTRRAALPPPMREMFGKQLWKWIGLNLVIGLMLPFIDNRGHIGGLIAGAVAGLVLHDRLTRQDAAPRLTTGLLTVACGVLLLAAFGGMAGG